MYITKYIIKLYHYYIEFEINKPKRLWSCVDAEHDHKNVRGLSFFTVQTSQIQTFWFGTWMNKQRLFNEKYLIGHWTYHMIYLHIAAI